MARTQINTERKDKTDRKLVHILGIAIDSITLDRVLTKITSAISNHQKLFITTPNPEIVLQAHHDGELRDALNSSDIAIADGFGLVVVGKYLQKDVPLHLIKGRELFMSLINLANDHEFKVILLGNQKGSADKAKKVLEKNSPKVKMYAIEGPNLKVDGTPLQTSDIELEKSAIETINKVKPEFVFVAFGAPRQEKWLSIWKSKLNANIFMVVGGAFDSISGVVSLPPKWWPKSLEWVFRLLTQPARIKRIINAVIIFPLTALLKSRA